MVGKSQKISDPKSWRILTRISHRLSATTSHIFMSTALHLSSLLNILTNMPASSVLRAPCIHEYLQGLATKPCEKSGLMTFCINWFIEFFYFISDERIVSARENKRVNVFQFRAGEIRIDDGAADAVVKKSFFNHRCKQWCCLRINMKLPVFLF